MQIKPPPMVAMGRVKIGDSPRDGIENGSDVSARPDEEGSSQRNQAHIMGEEIESQSEQDVNTDDGDHPFPIKGRHDQGKEKESHDQDQPRKEKIAHLLP